MSWHDWIEGYYPTRSYHLVPPLLVAAALWALDTPHVSAQSAGAPPPAKSSKWPSAGSPPPGHRQMADDSWVTSKNQQLIHGLTIWSWQIHGELMVYWWLCSSMVDREWWLVIMNDGLRLSQVLSTSDVNPAFVLDVCQAATTSSLLSGSPTKKMDLNSLCYDMIDFTDLSESIVNQLITCP